MPRAARARQPGAFFAALMGAYFFLVITSFWVLKPLKKGLFIRSYDQTGLAIGSLQLTAAQAELLAKVANVGVALVAALVFARLARPLRRERLAMAVGSFFLAGHALFAWLLAEPKGATVWSFYLYGDLYSTLMVTAFFAFLNDSVSPQSAKRLYGPIGLGGVLGGLVGASGVAALLDRLDYAQWMAVGIAAGLVILALAWAAGRQVGDAPGRSPARARGSDGAFSGARLVARSRYLLSIVAIVGLYEVTSTLVDFQFTSSVARSLDGSAIEGHFASVFAVTNGLALAVQLVVTPLVLTRGGVGWALLVLPGALLLGEAAFALLPTMLLGSALSVTDNGLNYSLQQSAREALYVPTSREEKYEAKAMIDMFVQRFAKVISVGLTLLLTFLLGDRVGVRWLAIPVALALAGWLVCARYAGRRFGELAERTGR
jgi:AAA family ATP:ADP antiporter